MVGPRQPRLFCPRHRIKADLDRDFTHMIERHTADWTTDSGNQARVGNGEHPFAHVHKVLKLLMAQQSLIFAGRIRKDNPETFHLALVHADFKANRKRSLRHGRTPRSGCRSPRPAPL